jgi:hypothetical protein
LWALETRFAIDDIITTGSTCLTDGPRDRKCDALYLDADSATAVIAQGYFAVDSDKLEAPAGKAADLNTAVAWIFGHNYAQMNESLQAAAQELELAIQNGEVSQIELWYVHNLSESVNVQAELDTAAVTARTLLEREYPETDISVGALEVGVNRLDEWYESIQNPVLVADTFELEVDGCFEEVGDDWTAVCVSVPATWLKDLHSRYGDKLFSANVRGYMPSRRTARNINFNIEQTARTNPGRFWAYNNGITALVHDYSTPESYKGVLRLHGLAIVNGAQTTGALSRSASPSLDSAFVLARFIRSENDQLVDEIIRYNNSQNPIKPADFRSTDRHQDRLRRQFERIPDAVYFGARRGGEQDRARRPSNAISSDTVAQCLAAFHGQPGIGYHELASIWENDQRYGSYFSDFTTAPHIVFAYSLLTAVQAAKQDFVNREANDELAEDEKQTLAVFRQRGSQFLLVAAIASCIEIVLGRRVGNRFSLSFGWNVSPKNAAQMWKPVVATMLPIAQTLRADELKGSLRNRARVEDALTQFRSIVRSTEQGNRQLFDTFAVRVEEVDSSRT